MKALAISYKGMEDITALEIKELIGKKASVKESCCVFECSKKELAKYCYLCQGANRVLILLEDFKIDNISDLKKIDGIDFSKWLKDGRTFAARSEIVDNELEDYDVQKTTGDKIDAKVDLDNPDITVFVYIYSDDCYVGVDFSGDTSKRDYKIKLTRDDLKGTIAYALVRLSGFEKGKSFLNLNAKTGTIAIESALFGSRKSVNFYNKQKFPFLKFIDIGLEQWDKEAQDVKVYAYDSPGYLDVVRKNAVVAGVDVKLEKIEADCVVRYKRKKAEIKDLKKEREIKHGKEVLKVENFID
ncbi:hypothetical protein GF361_02075 [Candidatus Woesearchaeota archaeon]|nr:hypothetical protein [Candidatus Woesearchaeota archaeon]